MSVGWTKAKELVNVITTENAYEWISKAKNMSVEELTKDVRRYLKDLIPDDEKEALGKADEVEDTPAAETKKRVSFDFPYEDYLAVSKALDIVKTNEQGIGNGRALGLICRDFVATNPADESEEPSVQWLVDFVKKYEALFGVQIVVMNTEERMIHHGFDHIKMISELMNQDASIEEEPDFNVEEIEE
jgi:hypothetical protein